MHRAVCQVCSRGRAPGRSGDGRHGIQTAVYRTERLSEAGESQKGKKNLKMKICPSESTWGIFLAYAVNKHLLTEQGFKKGQESLWKKF